MELNSEGQNHLESINYPAIESDGGDWVTEQPESHAFQFGEGYAPTQNLATDLPEVFDHEFRTNQPTLVIREEALM